VNINGVLKMKSLTKVSDMTKEDVELIMTRARAFDEAYSKGVRRDDILHGKVVAMVFEKPSLRTKVAFEVAATYLGGTPVFLSSSQILASGNNVKGRESIPDIGRNLERFCDLLVARVYSHNTIIELRDSITIPVINALCDKHHPTQALADLYTIRLKKPAYPKIKVSYVGDGNNVATSLMQISALMGMDFAIATPKGYEIPQKEREVGESFAAQSGSTLHFLQHPEEAVANADVVYTDTFVSMGQEEETQIRRDAFAGYQVNLSLLKKAKPDAVFMHCLPAHRGEEVTDEVMDSAQSIVFDEAGARLHIAKALISLMLE
jgi:ornithine carbamoyltransferase